MTKIYKGSESLKALEEGKILVDTESPIPIFYKMKDGDIFFSTLDMNPGEWIRSNIDFHHFIYTQFKEYECGTIRAPLMNFIRNPKNKSERFESIQLLSFDINGLEDIHQLHFKNDDGKINTNRREWFYAFYTLMKLKSHPLATAIDDSEPQYFIQLNCEEKDKTYTLELMELLYINNKIRHISPAFETKEHAEQAIRDIGHSSIVSMLKKMQGVN